MAGPKVIAHRAGKLDWPENTLCGFENAQQLGVDAIELDIQVTKDGVPVVYHPKDLKDWTNATGSISEKTWAEIQQLDATVNWPGKKPYTCRSDADRRIPSLAQVLDRIKRTPLILDLKSMPAKPLAEAIVQSVPVGEWKRLTVYSTERAHLDALTLLKPDVVVFEDRDTTFNRLVAGTTGSHECTLSSPAPWIGFELRRDVKVCEETTLSSRCTPTKQQMWTPETVRCARHMARGAQIVFFGVNTRKEFEAARTLGADAVFTDDPQALLPAVVKP